MLTFEDYVESLRSFIKDSEIKNIILEYTEENTELELDMYVQMALGFLNSIPPPIVSFDYGTFPVPSLLLHQAALECLISNGICHARNELSYNNGGITVKVSDSERYLKYIQVLMRMTDMEIKNLTDMKKAANLNAGWGGVFSPYASIGGSRSSLQPSSILAG